MSRRGRRDFGEGTVGKDGWGRNRYVDSRFEEGRGEIVTPRQQTRGGRMHRRDAGGHSDDSQQAPHPFDDRRQCSSDVDLRYRRKLAFVAFGAKSGLNASRWTRLPQRRAASPGADPRILSQLMKLLQLITDSSAPWRPGRSSLTPPDSVRARGGRGPTRTTGAPRELSGSCIGHRTVSRTRGDER